MPEDVDGVITELFDAPNTGRRERGPRWLQRLDAGVVHLDYGDDTAVFQLTVERVPRRRWAPDRPVPIGLVDGVPAGLVGVTVDNFVHVALSAALTPGEARDVPPDPPDPPDPPAERLMRVAIRIDDDLGTGYSFSVGEAGGTGTEREATQSFRPRPPAGVRALRLRLQAPGQPEVIVPVTLADTPTGS